MGIMLVFQAIKCIILPGDCRFGVKSFPTPFIRMTDIETDSPEYVLCDNRPQYFQAFKELAENQFLL